MSTEAKIHFELYRHLQNTIDNGAEHYGTKFANADPEQNVGDGYADIVVETDNGDPFLVIEAKREPVDEPDRNIDPYSTVVIDQAVGYAVKLGAPYFATYNGNRLVLFKTFDSGTHLLDRKTRAYKVNDISEFAEDLLREVAGVDANEVEWDPHHEAFVKRLKTFHDRLSTEFRNELDDKLEDNDFERKYEGWISDQGWKERYDDEPEDVHQDFTSQAAYLLMNKLVFYKLLEDTDVYEVPEVELDELVDPKKRQDVFKQLIDEVNFEAVYEQDSIFDSLPLNDKSEIEVEELLNELETYNLERFDHDVIGQIYEEIIPPMERYSLGQFYTPPEVVELITRLTVESSEDDVLDPACGSGGFLVAVYNHLKSLKQESGRPTLHQDILDQVHGIDINRFPAHLSAINLAVQNLDAETTDTSVFVKDFFDVRPGDEQLQKMESVSHSDGTESIDIPRQVDSIVGNPPYIRQEEISDKEKVRDHLSRVGADLNSQSDIYTYFFTHATEFLKDEGKLGFITSNQWLRVRYGRALQDFFLDNYKIHAIINSQPRVFEGQLVPTCITILEKCKNPTERDDNLINFIQIKKSMDVEEIIKKVDTDYEKDALYSEKDYKITVKQQRDLKDDNLWGRYLFAPTEYWDIVNHPALVRLGEDNVADVSYGTKTGANPFFFLRESELDDWNIEEQFLTKSMKTVTQFNGLHFQSEESEFYLFDPHEFVESVLASDYQVADGIKEEISEAEERYKRTLGESDEDPRPLTETEIYVTGMLKEQGHEGAYKYVLNGIEQGYYDNTSVSDRKVWFDIGEFDRTRLIAPKNVRGRPFFPMLSEAIPISDRFFHLDVNDTDHLKVVAGFLNSNVGKMFFELHGTTQRGGLAELKGYKLDEFPVLDPVQIKDEQKERIKEAYDNLAQTGTHEQNAQEKVLELDRAVLAPFGIEDRAEEIAQIATAISESRQQEKEFEVPVELEEEKTMDISGAERIEDGGQASLQDF